MTRDIVQLPDPDGSLLLRELNHRINNELTCVICAISAKATQSDNVAVKAALFDVADLLHQCADVHRALHIPDQGHIYRCSEVPPAGLFLGHEIPTGPPGNRCPVFGR